jgi:hypothetical protein
MEFSAKHLEMKIKKRTMMQDKGRADTIILFMLIPAGFPIPR